MRVAKDFSISKMGGIANTLICHAEVNGMNRNAILVICDETDTKYSEHSLVDKET